MNAAQLKGSLFANQSAFRKAAVWPDWLKRTEDWTETHGCYYVADRGCK